MLEVWSNVPNITPLTHTHDGQPVIIISLTRTQSALFNHASLNLNLYIKNDSRHMSHDLLNLYIKNVVRIKNVLWIHVGLIDRVRRFFSKPVWMKTLCFFFMNYVWEKNSTNSDSIKSGLGPHPRVQVYKKEVSKLPLHLLTTNCGIYFFSLSLSSHGFVF